MEQPLLSDYTDFRRYLGDFYNYKRSGDTLGRRRYSYSEFSAAANIRSPNYLKLIIDAKRNLSADMCAKFSRALGHDKSTAEEFLTLVRYGQSSDPLERGQQLKRLNDIRSGAISNETDLPSWITWVVMQMSEQRGVDLNNIQSIVDTICTQPPLAEVKRSLQQLLNSGAFERDGETGKVSKAREFLETPKDIPDELVKKLQMDLIYLGLEALFRDSPDEREFGAMTIPLTIDEFKQIKFELRQMRKKWNREFAANRKTGKGDRVYQLNVQLFPVTAEKKGPSITLGPEQREEKRRKIKQPATEPPVSDRPDLSPSVPSETV